MSWLHRYFLVTLFLCSIWIWNISLLPLHTIYCMTDEFCTLRAKHPTVAVSAPMHGFCINITTKCKNKLLMQEGWQSSYHLKNTQLRHRIYRKNRESEYEGKINFVFYRKDIGNCSLIKSKIFIKHFMNSCENRLGL